MRKLVMIAVATVSLAVGGELAFGARVAQGSEGAYTIAFASFAPIRTHVFIANGNGHDLNLHFAS
jgi:hypothetical protein